MVIGTILEGMKGKSLSSIIANGDVVMKNAINRVFPGAHHSLCVAFDAQCN